MFVRPLTFLFSVVAIIGFAFALPTALEVRDSNTCNSGNVQCCHSVQDASSTVVSNVFGWLGLPLPTEGTQVGLTCSPVTLGFGGLGIPFGPKGSVCTQQTVCCSGNTFYGVSLACSPITINL